MNELLESTAPAAPAWLEPVAADLEEVERILADTLASRRRHVADLVAHAGRFRGKRLRPVLLLLVGRACGPVTEAHHVLGAVVEMIHTATLVHDDVLDGAAVRRHVPTVNAGWGNHASILLGDYLFTQSFHLVSTLGDARLCRLIGEATNRVCEGELHQICERGNQALTEDEYFDIIDGKTAALTACCCRLGALVSGADDKVVEAMSRYGRALGMAFQIADDLLDLVGEEKATGKSLGTDLEQQKMTLPLIRLRDRGSAAARAHLWHILEGPGNHKREALAPMLAASDALHYARGQAEDQAARARAELACLPPSPARAVLTGLAEQVVHREC